MEPAKGNAVRRGGLSMAKERRSRRRVVQACEVPTCPLLSATLGAPDGVTVECLQDSCAWWVEAANGTEMCAVAHVAGAAESLLTVAHGRVGSRVLREEPAEARRVPGTAGIVAEAPPCPPDWKPWMA